MARGPGTALGEEAQSMKQGAHGSYGPWSKVLFWDLRLNSQKAGSPLLLEHSGNRPVRQNIYNHPQRVF